MTAFLSFLNTFAIWFYIGGVVAVLFGIKMLLDARRSARTTLFTLEQEQASERAFRAVLVMAVATILIAAVAGINNFVAPAIPPPVTDEPAPTVVRYTPPVILPTATKQPTLTPLPPTPGPTKKATAAPKPTDAPALAPTAAITPTAEAPVGEASPTPQLAYLAPVLNTPPNGDSIGSNNIRFSWGQDQFGNLAVPAHLPPDQFYRVVISYTSRTKNAPAAFVACVHDNSADRNSGLGVADTRGDSLDSNYQWTVTIVQATSAQDCVNGTLTPLSPTSASSSFKLP